MLLALLAVTSTAHFAVFSTDLSHADPSRADSSPALWADLVPGAYQVGYQRLGRGSGVVHVWYPARAASNHLTVRDYMRADTTRLITFLAGAKISAATVTSLLASVLFATVAPSQAGESFPLVLVAQGNGQDVFDRVVLCEYLASYGFVVATTPSPVLRMPLTRDDQVGPMAAVQGTELSIAIATVTKALKVDASRIGLVGHSFGARAALLLAMNNAKVKAMVSLDGGIGTATAVASFTKAPSFNASAALPPLLHFYETLDGFMAPDFRLIKRLHFQSVTLTPVEGMHHTHFTTYGSAVTLFADLTAVTRATAATGGNAVKVDEQAHDFLLRYLKAK